MNCNLIGTSAAFGRCGCVPGVGLSQLAISLSRASKRYSILWCNLAACRLMCLWKWGLGSDQILDKKDGPKRGRIGPHMKWSHAHESRQP